MQYNTDDLRITGQEEVTAPATLISDIPVDDATSALVYRTRTAVADVVNGRDPRLLVVVGPCSIHDPDAALEYAGVLKQQALAHQDDLLVLMRVYFEKPRTTVGWKGLINDPGLDETFDVNRGLRTARTLLRDITALGLPVGTEYLDPISPQYIADFVSWGAIGARTTESQVHRELASGLSCPIGFKNSTDGSVQVAVDAVSSARHPHIFLSVTKAGHSAIFSTAGNTDGHVILRGGGGRTNFDSASIHYASRLLTQSGLPSGLMVDMSHANSQKQHRNQLKVAQDICAQLEAGEQRIIGVMVESNLVEGRQDLGGTLTHGQSITDACLGWADTEPLLADLAAASRARRASGGAAPADGDMAATSG